MNRTLQDLEPILNIPDKARRFSKLESMAADLGVLDSLKAAHASNYNEQNLVIAIYDGFRAKEIDERKNRKFLMRSALGGVAILLALLFIPRAVISYVRYIHAKYNEPKKAYKGYDDAGELVKDEKGQPILFHDMDGLYDEYYDDGTLRVSYLYASGDVVEQWEYDPGGKLLTHFTYDKDGNPTPVEGE